MKQDTFTWFDGASFDQILAEMQAVASDPKRRIEFHLDHKAEEAFVFVEPAAEADARRPGINDSHVCPPVCP